MESFWGLRAGPEGYLACAAVSVLVFVSKYVWLVLLLIETLQVTFPP